jgi:hypothetical protein
MVACRWGVRTVWTAAVVAALAVLSGCSSPRSRASSAARPSATSFAPVRTSPVPPAPPDAPAIAGYLRTPGNAVVAFETATAPLGSGTLPSLATCKSVAGALSRTAAPNGLAAAIKGIDDTAMQVFLNDDVQSKLALLSSCIEGKATAAMASEAHATQTTVQQEFRQLGLTI